MELRSGVCPECGSTVELLAGRWLVVHQDAFWTSSQPVGIRHCLGSLRVAVETPGVSR